MPVEQKVTGRVPALGFHFPGAMGISGDASLGF